MKRLVLAIALCACNKGSEIEKVADPPPTNTGDCLLVGEIFAALELGNYAEPENRDPVVAKYKTACERAGVTKEQGECVVAHKTDKASAAACVPKMAIDVGSAVPKPPPPPPPG